MSPLIDLARRRRSARGQALLLFALTLIVLFGMVLATLSLATRTKGKMEMQVLADANAYTNAVATARALNGISIINRTMLSHWAAQAGGQALVSYATSRIALNRALHAAVSNSNCNEPPLTSCCNSHDNARAATLAALDANHAAYWANYDALDIAAEGGVTRTQANVGTLRRSAQELIMDMERQVAGNGLSNEMTNRLIQTANATGPGIGQIEWLDTQFVNHRELAKDLANRLPASTFQNSGEPGPNPQFGQVQFMGTGAIRYSPVYNFVMLAAAMGTRSGFASSAGSPSGFGADIAACDGDFACTGTSSGAGYWGPSLHNGSNHALAIGDHDGSATANYTGDPPAPCTMGSRGGTRQANAYVANADASAPGAHTWSGGGADANQTTRHRHGPCGACPSVWVRTFSFAGAQPDENGNISQTGDVYGQPKNHAALRKDLATVNDPWNRFIGIRFPATAATPSTWDLRADTVPARFRQMYAIGTGIAYYHRAVDWRESPNFLNPFWRATLTHGFVDNRADSDFAGIFQATPEVKSALDRLRLQGNVAMGAAP